MSKNYIEQLPEKFKQNVESLCSDKGMIWLRTLPQTIKRLENKWGINVEKHFSNLSYNYVATCIRKDGTPAVLKIALPLKNVEIFNEAKTLQIFNGNFTAQVLKIDKQDQAILIERLSPGRNLMEIFADKQEKSVDIAIDLMKKLYRESPTQKNFTNIDYWLNKLKKSEESGHTKKYLTKARKYFEKLNKDKEKIKFIHGDLHHENILSVENSEFAAIDPFGLNANVGYEIGLFLRVHLRWVKDEKLLINAIEKFSDTFDFSKKEIKQWAFVQHVMSACWDFEEDSDNWQKELEMANTWEII